MVKPISPDIRDSHSFILSFCSNISLKYLNLSAIWLKIYYQVSKTTNMSEGIIIKTLDSYIEEADLSTGW